MEASEQALREKIRLLLGSEDLGVLATSGADAAPYTSLVTFLATGGIEEIYFATFRSTKKYRNIKDNPKVSLLIDTRKNEPGYLKGSSALTALGKADTASAAAAIRGPYLERFPHLESFIDHPGCEFIKIRVLKYILVEGFHEVLELSL